MIQIGADDVREWLTAGREFAFVDVREPGQYGERHLLHPVNIPYSRLEIDAPVLIPRTGVPICLVDEDGSVAFVAASRLTAMGYTDVRVVEGGMVAYEEAGFTILKGVNVPSKVLGELVEEAAHTPSVGPEQLKAMMDAGETFTVLDGRSPKEFRKMSIPGASSCPNAELPYRLPKLVPDAARKVIINCAGRTRSIIGAQSLRDMGFKNPIFALRNGTQGWRLAGFELDAGKEPSLLPALDASENEAARARADAFIARTGIPRVAGTTFSAWADDTSRTLYLIDVRTKEEYDHGHLPGARHVAGGQLVQETDKTIAVRGARVVLCDDNGLRAAITARWLRAMGHDVTVLDVDVTAPEVVPPTIGPLASNAIQSLPEADATAVMASLSDSVVLDLRSSGDYRAGHIEGATWSIRPRLSELGLGANDSVVIVAENKHVAALAAIDLHEAGVRRISYLPGGPDAWAAAGFSIVATSAEPADTERIDFLFFVHDRHDGNMDAAREYLRWETGLVTQLREWELAMFTVDGWTTDGHGSA